jgi:hypothetical protein
MPMLPNDSSDQLSGVANAGGHGASRPCFWEASSWITGQVLDLNGGKVMIGAAACGDLLALCQVRLASGSAGNRLTTDVRLSNEFSMRREDVGRAIGGDGRT